MLNLNVCTHTHTQIRRHIQTQREGFQFQTESIPPAVTFQGNYAFSRVPGPSGSFLISPYPSQFNSVQSLSRVRLFATPWIAARQASLSITNSRSLLKLMSIESLRLYPAPNSSPFVAFLTQLYLLTCFCPDQKDSFLATLQPHSRLCG